MLRAMEPAAFRLAQLMIALFLALPITPMAGAQQTPMAPVAIRLADAIVHSKQKSVVVFDFSGPDKKVTQLGENLAGDLSADLAKSSGDIQVKQRSELEKDYFEPGTVLDPESMLLFARDLKAKVFVMGQISLSGSDTLILLVNAYRSDNGKGVAALKATLRLTEEMASSMAKVVADADLSSYPVPGKAGYSLPKCGYCPEAEYSDEGKTKQIQGVVELTGVVGTDGHVRNIAVVKGLPGGLTFQAIKAVRQWKLVPATGPDGKPAAVRQLIEVAFQLL
jgi:Gram-negative bacterial TonB protein C-terminal